MHTAIETLRSITVSPLWRYISTRYHLPLHAFYSLLWFLAISGVYAATQELPAPWQFRWLDLAGAASALGLFFFLRTVDEIKDVEYDRRYKPDRALVEGWVSKAQLWRYALFTGVLVLTINTILSPALGMAVLVIMGYSVFLLGLEKVLPAFERVSIYFSTAVSVQLKSAAVAYVFLFNQALHGGEFSVVHVLLISAFVLAYLHWEMGRKIALRRFIRPGEKSYSSGPGFFISTTICLLLMALACGILYSLIDPRLAQNQFYGLEWLPALGLPLSAAGMLFTLRSKHKRFPLGAVTQISYVACFLYGAVFLTNHYHHAAGLALSAPLLLLLNGKVLQGLLAVAAKIQLKIFKGFVNGTAWVARSRFHGFSRSLMRVLASAQCAMSKGKHQETLPAVAREWQRMFPISPSQMPVTKVTDDTVFMEIREPCPLRDTGDVGACNRLMEFDRHLLGKLGAQLVVLRSQAQDEGVTICQIALRKREADVSDLKSIYAIHQPARSAP
ncbi:hypothetical protein BH11PSE11_BH11PSE11_07500 [soil metagenome]